MRPEYYPTVFTPSFNVFDLLRDNVQWVNPQFARQECFMSDIDREYQYIDNGPIYKSVPLDPYVEYLMHEVNRFYSCKMNVCFHPKDNRK